MTAAIVFLVLVRWVHLTSAVAWVGGSLFYVLVLQPAARRKPEPYGAVASLIAAEFRGLADTCIIVLLATGAILSVDRLTGSAAGVPYAAALGAKIVLSLWMFHVARRQRRRAASVTPAADQGQPAGVARRVARLLDGYTRVAVLGVLVLLLADLLRALYEVSLASG